MGFDKEISLEAALNEVLTGYINEERETLFAGVQKGAKQCKKDLVELSPKKTGDYRHGWRVRTQKTKNSIEATVYNATDWQLTWLLENGHAIRNKYGPQTRKDGGGSRTTANPHISKAREKAVAYLNELLQETL